MFLRSLLAWLRPMCRPSPARPRRAARLQVEPLEDRLTPSGSYLMVASYDTNAVLRYNEGNGAFVDTIVTKNPGHLSEPYAVLVGPHDHNLYVSSGQFHGVDAVMRYDGATGAFLGQFADSTHLTSPRGIIFGPDGNLYVADGNGDADGRIVRYDGPTGAFLDEFVPIAGNGGLNHPQGLVFAPSVANPNKLDLYVASAYTNSVLRFDGTTGAFLDAFVPSGSGGLDHPGGLVFGPDGNLYVANFGGDGNRIIARFHGPSGPTPGAYLDTFVPLGRGGLETPTGLIFGPDGNGDGQQDLYVATAHFQGAWGADARTSKVLRYDGASGAYIDTFVAANSGRLDDPNFLIFTETDPVTLAYNENSSAAGAVSPAARSTTAATAATQVHGGGQARLTDPDASVFPLTFGLTGTLHSNGAAGIVNFFFGPAFGQVWGAVPDVDAIHLRGTVASFTAAAGGAVTLTGQLTEKDFSRSDGVAFVEESVRFQIVVSFDSWQFTLQWCELPTFDVDMTNGNLHAC